MAGTYNRLATSAMLVSGRQFLATVTAIYVTHPHQFQIFVGFCSVESYYTPATAVLVTLPPTNQI